MTLRNSDIHEDAECGNKLPLPALHSGTSFTLHDFDF